MIYVEIWHDDMPQHPMMTQVSKLQQSLVGEFLPKIVEPLSSTTYLETVLKKRRKDYPITATRAAKFVVWFCVTPHFEDSIQQHIQALITDAPKLVLVIFASQQEPATAQFLSALPRVVYREVNWADNDAFKTYFVDVNDMMDQAEIDPHTFLDKFLPTSVPPAETLTPPPRQSDTSTVHPIDTHRNKSVQPLPDTIEKRGDFGTTLMRRTPLRPSSDKIKFSPVTFGHIPAPKDDPYYYPEDVIDHVLGIKIGTTEWAIAGASRRGNSHKHKGTPRDDAMYFGAAGLWNIIAVADGAGSARLSRVTANESVERACHVISEFAVNANLNDNEYTKNLMKQALTQAVHDIHDIQTQFTHRNNLDKRDTYCTLLILIHQPLPSGGCVFATFQAGDGYMMGMSNERTSRIAKGDHGAEAGTSQFVLSFTKPELEERITTFSTDKHIHTFMLVTDGIEDDLKVSHEDYQRGRTIDDKASQFAMGLRNILVRYPLEHWGRLLFKEICYEAVGSNDDRTIVMLTPLPARKPVFHG